MKDTWSLPESVEIQDRTYEIRSDYRAVIDILIALGDEELSETDKAAVVLKIFYRDYTSIPPECAQEAVECALQFIDFMDSGNGGGSPVKLMDWEKDAGIIIPAVNKIAGREIRAERHLHWWTFMGMYMEIGDCLFSQVLNIRQKKRKGKKLEKWEKEFYKQNKSIIELDKEERGSEEKEALRKLFGFEKR